MPKQLVLSGKELARFLEILGFEFVRVKGSHHRYRHPDGRVTTVPIHKNDDLPAGLLRKIVRDDLEMELEDFERRYREDR